MKILLVYVQIDTICLCDHLFHKQCQTLIYTLMSILFRSPLLQEILPSRLHSSAGNVKHYKFNKFKFHTAGTTSTLFIRNQLRFFDGQGFTS